MLYYFLVVCYFFGLFIIKIKLFGLKCSKRVVKNIVDTVSYVIVGLVVEKSILMNIKVLKEIVINIMEVNYV